MKKETTNQNLLSAHPDDGISTGKEGKAKRPPSDDIFRKLKVSDAISPDPILVHDESKNNQVTDKTP